MKAQHNVEQMKAKAIGLRGWQIETLEFRSLSSMESAVDATR